MIVIRVNVTIKPEEKENFITLMNQEAADIQTWEGCIHFQLYENTSTANSFLLYEEWDSLDHFNAYRTSDTFKTNGQQLFPMMAGKPDSAYFEAAVVGP